jgi:glycerol-3-phosphate acyltransferase PlsY
MQSFEPNLPTTALGVALVSYILGSIPWGVIAGRAAGVDLRKHGSGNIGATNALRVLGKRYGYAVFVADALKGFVPVAGAVAFMKWKGADGGSTQLTAVVAAVFAIVGHSFPVWLKFKGGKGVATSAGAVLGLMPLACLCVASLWVIVFKISRYVSVASVVAALSLPGIVYVLLKVRHESGPAILWFSSVMALMVVWRHRANVQRLLSGTEARFERK